MRDEAPGAWRHFRRLMGWMAAIAVATIAVALAVLHAEGVVLRLHFVIALALAIGLSVLLAGGLMGLVFASHRGGYDDAVDEPGRGRRSNEKGRPGGRP
ncbi:MAG: hypothetical protein JO290_01785 [Sphingomonadaceae bacterium]|nr:hypothetical protein [Sphingomonadaceae bacterium]